MDELKEMQEQLNILKLSLKEYEIANEHLLKKIVNQKVNSINRIFIAECISLPIVLLLILAFAVAMKMNLWIMGLVLVISIISLFFDYKNIRISPKAIYSESLVEFKKRLLQQKRRRLIQNVIEAPLALAWLIWFFMEAFHPFSLNRDLVIAYMISLAVLVIATILIVIYLLKSIDSKTASIIEDIDESCKDQK